MSRGAYVVEFEEPTPTGSSIADVFVAAFPFPPDETLVDGIEVSGGGDHDQDVECGFRPAARDGGAADVFDGEELCEGEGAGVGGEGGQ